GVMMQSGSTGNLIGGTAAGARNVISGNTTGVAFSLANTQNNLVQGNYIGTDATGAAAVGNTFHAIDFNLATNNTIGGLAAGAGNVIAGNNVGVYISNAPGNKVLGNLIGTRADGAGALGNSGNGVQIFICSNNTVQAN